MEPIATNFEFTPLEQINLGNNWYKMLPRAVSKLKNLIQDTRTQVLMLMGYKGVYWWNGKMNFGDQLTGDILKYFSIPYVYAQREHANVVSTGSILDALPGNYSGAILGSGFIEKGPATDFGEATVYAVRGKLSQRRILGQKIDRLGDPGLLMDRIYNINRSKTFRLGIIPHYVDKGEDIVHKWAHDYPSDIKIIDVQRSPREVIQDIARCEYTISSSLHGIIVSHAFGIPCAWAKISAGLKGGDYKFIDYFSIYDEAPNRVDLVNCENIRDLIPSMWLPSVHRMNVLKAGIYDAFNEFSGRNFG